MNTEQRDTRRKSKEAPDWFGCGRTITQDSWDRFTEAYRLHHWKFDGKVSCRTCGRMFETLDPTTRNCPKHEKP